MNTDPLVTTILDLLAVMARPKFKLILGGGYGLYLKQLHLQKAQGVRTLLPGELWPYPRTTEDLDVFLPTEIVASLEDMRSIRAALDSLGFQPVAGAEFLQFAKPWHGRGRVKIDMLTGPISNEATRQKLKITPPRVRPRGDLQLHAYLTADAIDFDHSLLSLSIEGTRSDGMHVTATIFVPQPFTFLLMKLHAFADRQADANCDLGRHHALDVYRIIAMLTAGEYEVIRENVQRHSGSAVVQRARQIIVEYFSSATTLGVLRVREHALFTPSMDVAAMLSTLAELFS
ncbi:MAG TPA: hypothetical protein VH475_22750 [Tepidisphaeraceae bacterium]|jgi:hypothetical protein